MIIGGSEFWGDSREVANAQHNVYNDALKIIVKQCNRFVWFAQNVVQPESYEKWEGIVSFDHRTLQYQHDLLATVWRYQNQASQMRLDCDEDKSGIQSRWLKWLSSEVESWIERPEWVRLVQTILNNQNSPAGYRAETLLSLAIMDHFSTVPWSEKLRLPLEQERKHQSP